MGAVRNLVDELRRRGVTVHEWPGWDGRGNEGIGQIDPVGAVLHHTASGYGSAFEALVTGRPDLRGTLCNFAGNSDGTLTVISSGLAWHAGAGAGPSLGPLAPYRGWMNRWTVGLEIVYPGDQPMTNGQRTAALVFARTVADMFCGGDVEYVRAHAETNGRGGDGKWDPGYAPGQTIDMAAFRREAATASMEDDMPLTPNDGNVRWAAADPYDARHVETHPIANWIGFAAYYGAHTNQRLAEMQGVLAGLVTAVGQLADGKIDMDAILHAAEEGSRAAAADVPAPITIGGDLAGAEATRSGD